MGMVKRCAWGTCNRDTWVCQHIITRISTSMLATECKLDVYTCCFGFSMVNHDKSSIQFRQFAAVSTVAHRHCSCFLLGTSSASCSHGSFPIGQVGEKSERWSHCVCVCERPSQVKSLLPPCFTCVCIREKEDVVFFFFCVCTSRVFSCCFLCHLVVVVPISDLSQL